MDAQSDAAAVAAQGRYRRALAELGWERHVDAALDRVPGRNEGLRAMALASLLVRAAGVEAREQEAAVAYRADGADVRAARLTTGPPEDPRATDDERCFWEIQRTSEVIEALLTDPSGRRQDDPWLSAAFSATEAATDLLFGTIRQTTDLEHQVDGLAATMTREYLDRAEQSCRQALAAIDDARRRLSG